MAVELANLADRGEMFIDCGGKTPQYDAVDVSSRHRERSSGFASLIMTPEAIDRLIEVAVQSITMGFALGVTDVG